MTLTPAGDALIGQRLGRYRVSASLGRGGMAEVFRATDEELGREVAVKVVLPVYAAEEEYLKRFRREAEVVASLEHPNILPIYDLGEHRGLPFLVMPLVRGGTLADRLGRPLDPARAVAWVGDLAAALDAAHGAGVLHRDVKPGNVLIGAEERALLADFGIAGLSAATRLTGTGMVVGTPLYMAPEVAAGKPAAPASDGYSLAVMAYEMLAGRPPFEGENALSVLNQHATRPVPPITTRVDHLPEGVDAAFERALAKDPAARPASCRAFADLLASQVTGARAVAAAPPGSGHGSTLELPGTPAAPLSGPTEVGPPSGDAYVTVHAPAGGLGRLKLWVLAGLVGAAAGLGGFLLLRATDAEPPAGRPVAASPAPSSAGAVAPPPPAPAPAPAVEEPSSADAASPPPPAQAPEPAVEEPPSVASSAEPRSEPRPVSGTLPRTAERRRPADADAADAGAAASPRFRALRAFDARATERDFRHARDAAARLGGDGPKAGQARALERYAEGGMAYLARDDETAAAALHEALGNRRFVVSRGPGPLMLLAASEETRGAFESWELALGYGDPRASAGGELDRLLESAPEDPRYRFARALIHRLDGEHAAVVRRAVPVYHQLRPEDAEARGYLAQVVGDAYAQLGQGDEALGWYRRAVAAGGAFQGVVALRAAEAAHALQRLDEALEFLGAACDAGLRPACERLRRSGRRPRGG